MGGKKEGFRGKKEREWGGGEAKKKNGGGESKGIGEF